MKTDQVKKIAMYRAVDALLANAPETNAIVALPATRALFLAKLDELDALIATQQRPLGATIAERNQALEQMVDATLALAGVALSYADQKNLHALAIQARVSEGDFRRARLDQRVRMAQQLYAAVSPFAGQLADFGVTPALLDDLQKKIDAAAAGLPAARGMSVDKKAATIQLAAAIRATDAMLENQIDPLLVPLRKTSPQFYERYQVAREVVGRPGARQIDTPETPTGDAKPAALEPANLPPAVAEIEKLAA